MVNVDYDVIVVGAGVEGLATARYLAQQQGVRVLLLEQYPWPHNRGSSFGTTRITRLSYDKPEYGALMPEAHREWSRLEAETGTKLYTETGVLVVGPENSDDMKKYAESHEINKSLLEPLTEGGIRKRFSHINLPPNYCGTYEKTSGMLFANKALVALMKSFIQHGGKFQDSETLLAISEQPLKGKDVALVTVETNKAKYTAASVVLTLGPWAPEFLRLKYNLPLPIEAQKTIWCYWRVTKPGHYSAAAGVPAMLVHMPDDNPGRFFFKPSLEYEDMLNFGLHKAWRCDPNLRDHSHITDLYLKECREFAAMFLPHLDLSYPAIVESAMYTENVYDGGFVLDRIPGHPKVVVGTGFTGHGFKLAPMVGKILGDLALERKSNISMEPFSINRFPKDLPIDRMANKSQL